LGHPDVRRKYAHIALDHFHVGCILIRIRRVSKLPCFVEHYLRPASPIWVGILQDLHVKRELGILCYKVGKAEVPLRVFGIRNTLNAEGMKNLAFRAVKIIDHFEYSGSLAGPFGSGRYSRCLSDLPQAYKGVLSKVGLSVYAFKARQTDELYFVGLGAYTFDSFTPVDVSRRK